MCRAAPSMHAQIEFLIPIMTLLHTYMKILPLDIRLNEQNYNIMYIRFLLLYVLLFSFGNKNWFRMLFFSHQLCVYLPHIRTRFLFKMTVRGNLIFICVQANVAVYPANDEGKFSTKKKTSTTLAIINFFYLPKLRFNTDLRLHYIEITFRGKVFCFPLRYGNNNIPTVYIYVRWVQSALAQICFVK